MGVYWPPLLIVVALAAIEMTATDRLLNRLSTDLLREAHDKSYGFEAYYRFQATPCLQISPDVQCLIDPGIAKSNDDALVLGLRTLVHF